MSTSALHTLRHMTGLMRGLSATVLLAFTMLILMPTVQAAQLPAAKPVAMPASVEDVLGDLRDTALRARDKAKHGQGHKDEDQRLLSREAELGHVEDQAEADFAAIEQHLESHGLPEEIKQRHRQAVADYRAKMKELKARLGEFRQARDRSRAQRALNDLADFLQKEQKTRTHQPFDPRHLPFRTPDDKIRAPKENKQELDDIIHPMSPVKVAATEFIPGLLAQAAPSTVPTLDDLVETEDVQINDTIKRIAQDLENSPVKIFNWVRDNIEFVPTYGSIQGAQQTYENHKGNAFDTASLLIALLRAAKIPARYVYGTIQVPTEQVMNWVGGASTPEIAQSLLGQGRIPNTALVSGGKIAAFKLEHVWVEAFVDYIPSRGAINKVGDTWVPMDAGFKQYDFSKPLANSVPVPDTQALVSQLAALGNIDEANAIISGYDINDYRAIADPIIANTTGFLETTAPNATTDEFLGSQSIRANDLPILAGTLPYQVIAAAGGVSQLADSLRHKAKIEIFANDIDLASDNPDVSYSISLPKINGARIGIKYMAASPSDEQVLQDAINSNASSIPAYLVKLKPAIQLDDTTVSEGSVVGMGESQIYRVTLSDPQRGNTDPAVFRGTAGDLSVLSLDGVGLEAGAIAARHRSYVDLDIANQRATFKTNRKTAEESLYLTALSYWEQYTSFDRLIARTLGMLALRLPSIGRFTHPVAITYSFGIPRRASYGSTQVDIKRIFIAAAAKDAAQRRAFIQASGIFGSAMEGLILDQVNSRPAGTGVSAVRLIALALEQGQRVILVNSDNLGIQLARIQASEAVKADIRNAVAAGLVAITPEQQSSNKSWVGSGYILANLSTGEAAYRISEGLNGGGIFGPPTANVQNAGPFGTQGFVGGLGATAVLKQGGSIQFNLGPAARSLLPLMRAFVGPMTVVAGTVVMVYFAQTLWAMHHATIEEEVENGITVAESATDCTVSPSAQCNQCQFILHDRRPPRRPGQTNFWAQLIDQHHDCANSNTDLPSDKEFTAIYSNLKRSFDTARSPIFAPNLVSVGIGGEVKTTGSTKSIPGPQALGYFLTALSVQIAQQRKIAEGCGFGYELIVQEPWQKLLAGLYTIPANQLCPSKGVNPPSPDGQLLLQLFVDIADLYLDVLE
jgi:hypothetical protein